MGFKNLQVGEVLSESQYYKVVKMQGNKVQLENDKGENIVVNDQYVDNQLLSALQYSKEEKVNQTELIEVFLSNPHLAMTVMFNKKVDPKDVTQKVTDLYDEMGIGMTKAAFQKKVKAVTTLKGVERVMTGRHHGSTKGTGRVSFVDMAVTKGIRDRQVDPRTLNYVIVGGVKYILK